MTTEPGAKARKQLREFLNDCVQKFEGASYFKSTNEDLAFLQVLRDAVEALDALDHGQVNAIFELPPGKFHGLAPYTVRMLQLRALGHMAVLRALGWKAYQARAKVAELYGIKNHNIIEKWPGQLSKMGNGDVQDAEFAALVAYLPNKKRNPALTAENVTLRIAEDGKAYKPAHAPKKTLKKIAAQISSKK